MQLHELYPFPEERKKRRRVGRGPGSGLGGTSGRGHKGQNARSGGGVRPGFEGGQMPLQRRLPKHGFKNALFKIVYQAVDLDSLQEAFPGRQKITIQDIYARGLAHHKELVKILARGEVNGALEVEAHRFSRAAAAKIIAAGGKITELLGDGLELTAEGTTAASATGENQEAAPQKEQAGADLEAKAANKSAVKTDETAPE